MAKPQVMPLLKSLDRRVSVIEQKLPTLATKDDLHAFATKDDLQTLATKDELKSLATKDDLKSLATKDEVRELGMQLRLEMKVLFEEQWDKIKGLFDRYRHHDQSIQNHGARLDSHDQRIGGLDLRVTALEHPRPRT